MKVKAPSARVRGGSPCPPGTDGLISRLRHNVCPLWNGIVQPFHYLPETRPAPELPRYFPAFDGLRFACCTAVIVSHCLLSPEILADQAHPLRAFAENLG